MQHMTVQNTDDPRIHVRVDSDLKKKVGVAAELNGLSTSEFIRQELRDTTRHIDIDDIENET